ncbi:MAG: hypothetical protein K0M70_08125, partial [Arenimonas sp.]|uniref:hypothetical protein n=1 Tax=Arenimonas sp. TaxID=1872635 RepID=UPI0025B7C8A4
MALPAVAAAQAVGPSPGFLLQLVLFTIAIALGWLLWRVRSDRLRQETSLLGEIREREERLNLALGGSGDVFWYCNIRDSTLYRLGANQLLGQGSREELST